VSCVAVWKEVLTLGTRKVTLLLARRDSTVDMTPKGSIAEVADLVVGLDVLLDCLTAVGIKSARALMVWDESMTMHMQRDSLETVD
jgi:hypothetical protein